MTRAKDISKILTDADISGDIDVDGVTNLDVVDIDGAVDMASTLTVSGAFTSLGIDDNANATAITMDSSENVGIGTSSPNGVLNVVQASNTSALLRLRNNTADTSTADGMIFTITDASAPVGSIEMVSGGSDAKLAFRTNGSERMRIDSSGRMLLGTTTEGEGNADDLTIATTGHTGITIRSGTSAEGSLLFSDGTSGADEYRGYVQYLHSANALTFGTNAVERMRIDSSGNVLVGKTSDNNALEGISLAATGAIKATNSSDLTGIFNRLTTDGNIVQFWKDGTTVGTIGNAGARLFINSGTVGLNFAGDGSDQILPSNAGANRDNAITLGATNVRFKDLYLSGGAFLGGTGAVNLLDDYEEGVATVSFTSSGASFNYTIRQCYYTKVGRIVHIQIYMQLDGSQTLTGNTVTITGLPFTSLNSSSHVTASIAGIRYVSLDTNYTHLQARIASNTTTLQLLQNGAGQPGVNLNSNDLSNASGQIFINMSYITAQ